MCACGESPLNPIRYFPRQCGVAGLVPCDTAHRPPDVRVARESRLPHADERTECLAYASLDGVLCRDGFKRTNRAMLDPRRTQLPSVARRDRANDASMAHLVPRGPSCSGEQASRRAMGSEFRLQDRKRLDAGRFAGRKVGEPATNHTTAARRLQFQARRTTPATRTATALAHDARNRVVRP